MTKSTSLNSIYNPFWNILNFWLFQILRLVLFFRPASEFDLNYKSFLSQSFCTNVNFLLPLNREILLKLFYRLLLPKKQARVTLQGMIVQRFLTMYISCKIMLYGGIINNKIDFLCFNDSFELFTIKCKNLFL